MNITTTTTDTTQERIPRILSYCQFVTCLSIDEHSALETMVFGTQPKSRVSQWMGTQGTMRWETFSSMLTQECRAYFRTNGLRPDNKTERLLNHIEITRAEVMQFFLERQCMEQTLPCFLLSGTDISSFDSRMTLLLNSFVEVLPLQVLINSLYGGISLFQVNIQRDVVAREFWNNVFWQHRSPELLNRFDTFIGYTGVKREQPGLVQAMQSIVNGWSELIERGQAVVMGSHDRLGAQSLVQGMPEEVMQIIDDLTRDPKSIYLKD